MSNQAQRPTTQAPGLLRLLAISAFLGFLLAALAWGLWQGYPAPGFVGKHLPLWQSHLLSAGVVFVAATTSLALFFSVVSWAFRLAAGPTPSTLRLTLLGSCGFGLLLAGFFWWLMHHYGLRGFDFMESRWPAAWPLWLRHLATAGIILIVTSAYFAIEFQWGLIRHLTKQHAKTKRRL